jgi:hypothetical protein
MSRVVLPFLGPEVVRDAERIASTIAPLAGNACEPVDRIEEDE